jgi:hypothetical protein
MTIFLGAKGLIIDGLFLGTKKVIITKTPKKIPTITPQIISPSFFFTGSYFIT